MLTIRHIRHWYEPRLPHAVFLDGFYAGTIRDSKLHINAPQGSYNLRIQVGGLVPIGKRGRKIDISLSSTKQVEVPRVGNIICEFHDRERLWNILFDIDLIAWMVSWFVTMPHIYKILSNAFFVVWLVRLAVIRKNYYKIVIK